MPELPDAGQNRRVRKTLDRQIGKVAKRLGAALARHLPEQTVAADNLCNLDVQQVKCAHGFGRVQHACLQCLRGPCAEQYLEHQGGIDDNHRPSRSALRASTIGSCGETGVR